MSGKFINTERKDTIDKLVGGLKERLKNPYYLHSDKKPTVVNYYSINEDQSTLDEGLKIEYTQIKDDSPFRYNKIENMYLYGGLDILEINMSNTEFGLASDSLEGVTTILPDTVVPIPGDHFSLLYMDEPALFEVTSVNIDTLESGANMYRVEFSYTKPDTSWIDKLVVETFKFIPDNSNTKLKPIIKSTTYDLIYNMEMITSNLKKFYKELFYTDKVQSFIFSHNHAYFYDANMTEFLIKNKLLEDSEFLHICHQMSTHKTFGIDYTNTIFWKLENKLNSSFNIYAIGKYIDQPISILSMTRDEYFSIHYVDKDEDTLDAKIEIFDESILSPNIISVDGITDKYELDKININNIIIKYFNNNDLSQLDLENIDSIHLCDSITLFYGIPILIFIIEQNILKNIKK